MTGGEDAPVCVNCNHRIGYHAGVLGCLVMLGARVSELHRCGCTTPAAARVRQVGA